MYVPGKAVNVMYEQHDLLKVAVTIYNIPILALIDTGASNSIISGELVDSMNFNTLIENRKLRVIGDTINVGRVSELPIVIENITMMAKFIVLPNYFYDFDYKIILGSDFFMKHNINVCISEKRLTKYFDENSFIDIYFKNNGELRDRMINSLSCYIDEDISLEPYSVIEAKFKTKYIDCLPNDVLFSDRLIDDSLKDKVKVLPGICNNDTKSVLLVSSESKVNIRGGKVLGSISSILELPDDGMSAECNELLPNITSSIELTKLSDIEKDRVFKMIQSHSGVLSSSENDIGCARVTEHAIKLYDDTPIYHRPRRLPPPISQEIESQCQQLSLLDIIEPSNSPWSSPVVPIRKSDGTIRMCIDYRALNKVTIKDRFPIPCLTDSLYGLKGNKFFTSLDLIKGYYQVPIEAESRQYTAFSTSKNHWQFKRLAFGLCNAPATFQREIQSVLNSFPSNKVVAYLDDILIMSHSFEEHLELVSKVLNTLNSYGIKLKLSKCKWFSPEIEYLGHTINEDGLRKTEKYMETVANYPMPQTIGELRSFLGLYNFQRKFVPNCSSIQKPLTSLTGKRKNTKIVWTNEMRDAFGKLKELMTDDLQLAYPDYSEEAPPLEVWVDASGFGAGAMLRQVQGGRAKVITYASMAFTDVQRSYSTLERELTALRWGIKTFKPFIWGVHFVLMTDHQPLVYLHNMKLVCSRTARTVQELAEYNFEIRYVPGNANIVADTLSRVVNSSIEKEGIMDSELPRGLMVDGAAAPGGGDSMFISLYKVLSRQNSPKLPDNFQTLREMIIDELLSHSERYKLALNRNSRKEVKLMRHAGQLPSLEVLLVVSYLFRVKIFVYFFSTSPVIYQYDNYPSHVSIQCLGGIHFNPLVETRYYSVPNVVQSNLIMGHNIACERSLRDTSPDTDPYTYVNEINFEDDNAVELSISQNRCIHAASPQPKIYINVGGYNFCAIIDSGSQASLVTDGLIEHVRGGVTISSGRVFDIVGLTGNKIPIDSSVDLRLKINEHELPSFQFALVGADIIPCCMLLGLDFLETFKFRINFSNMSCNFYDENICGFELNNDEGHGSSYGFMVQQSKQFNNTLQLNCGESELKFELSDNFHIDANLSLDFKENELSLVQSNDHVLQKLKNLVGKGTPTKNWPSYLNSFKRHNKHLKVKRDLLYYAGDKVVVPVTVLTDIAILLHNSYAHIGRDKLLHLVGEMVWHPSKYSIINDISTTCYNCQVRKVSSNHQSPPVLRIVTHYPFELVAIDLIMFPRTTRSNIGCVTLIDHYSKFAVAVPIKNKTSLHVTQILRNNVFPYLPSLPVTLLSDNGSEFRSETFGNFLTQFGVKQQLTTPLSPSSNGLVERFNRTLQTLLRSLHTDGVEWDDNLPRALLAYNNSTHSEIDCSPSSFLLSKPHRMNHVPLLRTDDLTERWNDGGSKYKPFKIGDQVLTRVHLQGNLTTNKLMKNRYFGPFIVLKVNSNKVTYQLESLDKLKVIRVHHRDIVYYKEPPDYLLSHPWFDINVDCNSKKMSDNCDTNDNFLYSSDDSDGESIVASVPMRPAERVALVPPACKVCILESQLDAMAQNNKVNEQNHPENSSEHNSSEPTNIFSFGNDNVQVWEFSGESGDVLVPLSPSGCVSSPHVNCNSHVIGNNDGSAMYNDGSDIEISTSEPDHDTVLQCSRNYSCDNVYDIDHVLYGNEDVLHRDSNIVSCNIDDVNVSSNDCESLFNDGDVIDEVTNGNVSSFFGYNDSISKIERFIDESYQYVKNLIVGDKMNPTTSTPVEAPQRALRSKGPVEALPNVQPKILERRNR